MPSSDCDGDEMLAKALSYTRTELSFAHDCAKYRWCIYNSRQIHVWLLICGKIKRRKQNISTSWTWVIRAHALERAAAFLRVAIYWNPLRTAVERLMWIGLKGNFRSVPYQSRNNPSLLYRSYVGMLAHYLSIYCLAMMNKVSLL